MELVVEVGNMDQQELIRQELSIFRFFGQTMEIPLNILGVIVPRDFDQAVNSLQGISGYKSIRRSHMAIGKTINKPEGTYFVFSHELYQIDHDNQTRFVFYLHELQHAINYWRFPEGLELSPTEHLLFKEIYRLYDEYYCNRIAFEVADGIYPDKSKYFTKKMATILKGHYKSLISCENDVVRLQGHIDDYRYHEDIDEMMKTANEYYAGYVRDLLNLFSMIDHFTKFEKIRQIAGQSEFVNEIGLELMNYLKVKYEAGSLDLLNGLDILNDYFANFGMEYEDTSEGIYCHIFDL